MPEFLTFSVLTAVMGLSIFLSLPIVLHKRMDSRTIWFLTAAAIGILVFLIADIYSDVAVSLAASSTAYLTDPRLDLLFVVPLALAFVVLYLIDNRRPASPTGIGRRAPAFQPMRIALIVAIGMGFQNFTEGLVFGSAWVAGISGTVAVVFLGFFVQNITEGFPVGAPVMGLRPIPLARLIGYFLIAGVPTIVGGWVGFFWNSTSLDVLFDGLAVGALVYVIVPMIRHAMRPEETALATFFKHRIFYAGLLVGFLVGFAVNAF